MINLLKKKWIIFFVFFVMTAGVAGVVIFKNKQDETLTLYGNVDIRTVNLSFRVAGRLSSLSVDEGDSVKASDIVAKLDPAPYLNARNEALSAVESAQAQLDLLLAGYREEEIAQARSAVNQQQEAFIYAENFYKRQQQLSSSGAVAANDLENARTTRNQAQAALELAKHQLDQYQNGSRKQQIDQAKSNLAQAQASADQATLDLKDTELSAPANGIILTRVVEPGTMLSAGETVLNLSLMHPVWIRAYVDELNLHRAISGATVQIFTDSRPEKPYSGKIGFVATSAEFTPKNVETPELRTDLVYRLRIIVIDPDDALRQGMPVTLRFPASQQE